MSSGLPSYEQAALLVAARAAQIRRAHPASERVELALSPGRVLAEPLYADQDQPAFPRSTRDGYACRAQEANANGFLAIAGATRAGDPPAGPLPADSAWEIMTGAPVPEGADAVMMIEHVEIRGATVRLQSPRTIKPGENIVAQGAQARAGDELLPAGTTVHFPQIALAASCGYASLNVFVRPRVAILATGDELVSIESSPAPGQIRNSNAPMLASMVAAADGEPWILPTAGDNDQSLDRALAQAIAADMLLITGGVSAGKFDLVEPALARIGARFHFTGVRIQPGKPLVFCELPASKAHTLENENSTKCFGLPGNPVSSAVTFLLFAAPILAALAGSLECSPRFALARMTGSPEKKKTSDLTRFLPASCTFSAKAGSAHSGAFPEVALVPWQGSGDLAAMARSNCFLVLPEGEPIPEAGSIVRILLP